MCLYVCVCFLHYPLVLLLSICSSEGALCVHLLGYCLSPALYHLLPVTPHYSALFIDSSHHNASKYDCPTAVCHTENDTQYDNIILL